MSELSFIDSLTKLLPKKPNLLVGIGDDCALVDFAGSSSLLFTTDMLMDRVHFNVLTMPIEKIGRKCLAVNLSDIAAMAGTPIAALVALALPRNFSEKDAAKLMTGMSELAGQFDVSIIGGDTNSWDGPLVVSVTVVGTPHARGSVLRSGAKVGDVVMVSGKLGGSIEGRHLDFTPRVLEAAELHSRWGLNAMIDLSDGLATDARHICEQSKVGIAINLDALPISEALQGLSRDEQQKRAMCDGEDFELCFTLPKAMAEEMMTNFDLYIIGEVVAEPGLWKIEAGRSRSLLDWSGYQHRF